MRAAAHPRAGSAPRTPADGQPGYITCHSVILDDTPVWLDAAAGLMALRRSLLTKQLGTITTDALASLDARLAAALDH